MLKAEPGDETIEDPRHSHLGRDVALGLATLLPLFACATLAFMPTIAPVIITRTLAVIWASGLLAFSAGVRRGLSFTTSTDSGGHSVMTQLALFGAAMLSMMFCSPVFAAIGLVGVGALDALAARRVQAPAYFTPLRPIQMALGAAAMLIVQIRAV